MTNEEISIYMEAMEKTVEAGSVPQALMPQLAEGITRIGYHETEETKRNQRARALGAKPIETSCYCHI